MGKKESSAGYVGLRQDMFGEKEYDTSSAESCRESRQSSAGKVQQGVVRRKVSYTNDLPLCFLEIRSHSEECIGTYFSWFSSFLHRLHVTSITGLTNPSSLLLKKVSTTFWFIVK
jgi:hypothetical protein